MATAALNEDQRAGISVSGKPSYTIEQAAAQLARYGLSWANAPGQGATVTYAYRATAPETMPEGTGGFQQFSSGQIDATERALAAWASVANITFVRVGSGTSGSAAYSNNATILFADYSTGENGATAFAYLPGDRASSAVQGDVWVNSTLFENMDGRLGQNSYGYETLLHEIGHAIGLSHPSDYDEKEGVTLSYQSDASYFEDSREYTLMSYFNASDTGSDVGRSAEGAFGPLIDDIAAAQRIYGANTTSHLGDDVYTALPNWRSIWDAEGIDTFDFSRGSSNQKIDLRPGSFSDVDGFHGGLSIALGTIIENANGGSGDDQIIGNAAANILHGNGGNDLLRGLSGDDTYIGDSGDDRALLSGSVADYSLLTAKGGALLLQVADGSGSAWIDPSTEIVQFGNGQYLAYRDVTAYVRSAQVGGTTIAARTIGETRSDGTSALDLLFVDGRASDYTLSRDQRDSSVGVTGDFVLINRRDPGNIVHVGEAIDQLHFRDGQYLSLRDLSAYVSGTSTLAIGGTQNDLLYRNASYHYEIFVGGGGDDILFVDGNATDYTGRTFTGTSEPDGSRRSGFNLVARAGNAELFIDSSVEIVQFRNGQYLALKDIPAYVGSAGAQAGDVHVATHGQISSSWHSIAATGAFDTVYVEGNVGDYRLSRSSDGAFILDNGRDPLFISQGIDVVRFGDGQYLSITDLPAYMRGGTFTNGTDQDDLLWAGKGADQYVLGRDGFDNLYLDHNVADYLLHPVIDFLVPYDPYAGASVSYKPAEYITGYELVSNNGSENIYVDRSTEVIHFQDGRYLAFGDLPFYIHGLG
ncbi:Matrixin [Sphingomonas gellani]|uniref:Matrixin n=1 Tax=Sphingomonas gellani TaxID=1166340 RepID=A0A1H8I5Y6_9SPHN|nr:M10 family metallopeptidase C-terminal domain-containing protein [Sphingomonas gellani]SEN63555.1 Matrixin [Sphingomonas gellani]